MMHNTRYLPESFEQCRLEKRILRHFPYNFNVRSRRTALIQDGRKKHESAYYEQLPSLFQFQFEHKVNEEKIIPPLWPFDCKVDDLQSENNVPMLQ